MKKIPQKRKQNAVAPGTSNKRELAKIDAHYYGVYLLLGIGILIFSMGKPSCEKVKNKSNFEDPSTEACMDGESRECGPIESGIGECHTGTETCVAGSWGHCLHAGWSSQEVCDGLDNDCDGTVDDGIAQIVTGTDVGACQTLIEACGPSGMMEVIQNGIGPTAEVCDGVIDDDCDGTVDEGCSCTNGSQMTCGATNVGACELGTQTCLNGVWDPTCVGEVTAIAEVCDGIDNDCNGVIDNGIPPIVTGTDVGACQTQIVSCVGGSLQITQAGITPIPEVCDGAIDNDCDGATDEGCSCTNGTQRTCGITDVGVCEFGTQTCLNGAWETTCHGVILPSAEVCDHKDNDCDGQVDEGISGGLGAPTIECFKTGIDSNLDSTDLQQVIPSVEAK